MVEEIIICPNCGHENPPDARFCQNDGFSLFEGDTDDPLVGRLVGNYRLLSRKGEGGFGVVYHAEHRELGTRFAVKILHPQFSANRQVAERFRREALAAGKLRHEHVVYIADFGHAKGIGYYYAMEYLEGRTLKEVLEQDRYFTADRILHIARQVTSAMERVHSLNIIHRDLKPENIFLIEKDGIVDYVKLVDFGIAKILDDEASNSLTRTGLSVGTPLYMSPEQARGKLKTLDRRTDIYSWGVILFELITGRPPFFSESPHDVVMLHIKAKPPKFTKMNRDREYSEELESLVHRLLAKKPTKRPSSMMEAYQLLEEVLSKPNALIDPDTPSRQSAFAAPPPGKSNETHDDDKLTTPISNPATHELLADVETTQINSTGELVTETASSEVLADAPLSPNDSNPPESHPFHANIHPPSAFGGPAPTPEIEEEDEAQATIRMEGFHSSNLLPQLAPQLAENLGLGNNATETTSETEAPEELPETPAPFALELDNTVDLPDDSVDDLEIEFEESVETPSTPTLSAEDEAPKKTDKHPTFQPPPGSFSTNPNAIHGSKRRLGLLLGLMGLGLPIVGLLWWWSTQSPKTNPEQPLDLRTPIVAPSLPKTQQAPTVGRDVDDVPVQPIHSVPQRREPPTKQKPTPKPPEKRVEKPTPAIDRTAPRRVAPTRRSHEPRARQTMVYLQVRSKPSAIVFANGKRFGVTPQKVPARIGSTVRIRLQRKGYHSLTKTWRAQKNKSMRLTLRSLSRRTAPSPRVNYIPPTRRKPEKRNSIFHSDPNPFNKK